MPKVVTPLTDTLIKALKSSDKFRCDGNGLFIIISASGTKWWRFDYTRPTGGRNSLSLGEYPLVTLQQARNIREDYRKKLQEKIDPSLERQEEKKQKAIDSEGLFRKVLYEWFEEVKQNRELMGRPFSKATIKKKNQTYERDLLSYKKDGNTIPIGLKHIGSISHNEIYDALAEKKKTCLDTAGRLFNDCDEIWRYAVLKGYASSNVIANLPKSSFGRKETKHHPKITDEKVLVELMEAIEAYDSKITRYALKFVLLNPLRAMNLGKDQNGNDRALKWECIDFEKEQFVIPREKMKTQNRNLDDFVMPLSRQSVQLLKELYEITGSSEWLFPSSLNFKNPMNKETVNRALERMGFNDESEGRKTRTHGFRGAFRSLSETHETEHGVSEAAREACLDHHEKDLRKRAYKNKAVYTVQMRKLLQWWADFLDALKAKN